MQLPDNVGASDLSPDEGGELLQQIAVQTQFRSSDRTEAFEHLILPLLSTGFALACSMLENRQAAEDAVQEAALKAWKHLPRLKPGGSPRSWFLTIVANQCRDTLRGSWWRWVRGGELPESAQPDKAEQLTDHLDLQTALSALSREQRALLFLRYGQDMPVSELAEVLSLPEGTVKSRLHRCLAQLQVQMSTSIKEESQ